MKRASLSFDQSLATNDEAKDKFKYQTLLKEYLELQKEYVCRKRKVQAAKQKRELVLSEVRFLKRKQKSFLKSQAPDTDKKVPLHTLQSGRNPGTLDQLLLSNSCLKDKEGGDDHAYEEELKLNVRCKKKIKNRLIRNEGESKRKFCLLA